MPIDTDYRFADTVSTSSKKRKATEMTDRRTNSARRTFIQHLAWEIEAGHRTTDEARRQLEAMGIPLEAQCRLLKDAAERHDRSRTANLSEAYREYWTKFDQNRGVA